MGVSGIDGVFPRLTIPICPTNTDSALILCWVWGCSGSGRRPPGEVARQTRLPEELVWTGCSWSGWPAGGDALQGGSFCSGPVFWMGSTCQERTENDSMFAASVGPQEPTGSSHSHPLGCTESLAAKQMPPRRLERPLPQQGPVRGRPVGLWLRVSSQRGQHCFVRH